MNIAAHHVSVLFEGQTNLRTIVDRFVIHQSSSPATYPYQPISSYTSSIELNQAVSDNWWPSGISQTYDIACLFANVSGPQFGQDLGHALDKVCFGAPATFSPLFAYDVSKVGIEVLAHELGHTLGASHDFFNASLMSEFVNGHFLLSNYSLNQVIYWRDNYLVACLPSAASGQSAPVVSAVSPLSFTYAQNQTLTIQGSNLFSVYSITLGGRVLQFRDLILENDSQLTIPSGLENLDVGSYTGTVTSAGGSASFIFSVDPVPTPLLTAYSAAGFVATVVTAEPLGYSFELYSMDNQMSNIFPWPILLNRGSMYGSLRPLNSNGRGANGYWTFPANLVGQTMWIQAATFDSSAILSGATQVVPVVLAN